MMKKLNLQGRLGDSLALLAGGSLPLAYAPYALFPIAVFSPALLFILWQNVSPQRAFWRGWLYGIGLFSVGVSWVHISFHQFGGIPLFGAILLTACFVLGMGLYPALLGRLLTRFFPNNTPIKFLFVLPAAWTLIEWLRGWFLTGFPWLSLGYSQIDSPLSGFAPIFGIYGVSWMTVLTAALLVYLFNSPKIAGWGIGNKEISPKTNNFLTYQKRYVIPIFLLITIWGSGWYLSDIAWTKPIGESKKIALIQGNIPQEFKWHSGYQIPSMERYLHLTQDHHDADIIIWPETAVPLFYHDVSKYIPDFFETLSKIHLQHGPDFLIGIPVMEPDGRYFNSVTSFGSQTGFYYKHHLVPFGEYIPFQSIFGNLLKLLDVPLSEFSAGSKEQTLIKSAGEFIGISICYEDAFSELVRRSLPAATLLVNVSNDAWFGDSIAPHQHLEIARMRALENGRYLLRATNTGISAIIDAKGKIITKAPQFQVITLAAQAQPYQGTTPFVQVGNTLIVTILILCVLLAWIIQHIKNKE
jgi:apolipoprotein N-acyltransferase